MIERKLEALFSDLTEDEIKAIGSSDIDIQCDIAPGIYSAISARVSAKTQENATIIPVVSAKKQGMGKKIKMLIVAAAVFVFFAVGAGAAYQFLMPDRLNEELGLNDMHIKTVVDTKKADENSVKTMQKTVNTNGYTVTFEAIVDGYVILPEFIAQLKGYEGDAEIREDRIYAIMTITRDDGKSVLEPDGYSPTWFCCDYFFNFNVAVKGYAPNSSMFTGTPWHYEEGNLLYYLCDVTDAAKFADRELAIIIFNETTLDGTIARMDENGEFYFVDTYEDFGAIFDLDLDDSLADPEAVAKDIAERPYVYVTEPDYTVYDEMIAKDEAVKNTDLSYAIGNHRWYGWDPLQFGEVEHAEDFIELFANKSELAKTSIDALNKFIDEESVRLDVATTAEIERLSGKDLNLMTDDELYEIADEIDAFIKQNEKIKAGLLRENFDFLKFDDGSEYCYIDEFTFLYIPKGSEYAKLVIVYGDRIVISLECTVDTLRNHYDYQFHTIETVMPGSLYSYWYLFGVDEDSRYAKLYNEEDYNLYSQSIRSEQDAIFNLIREFTYYEGTVQVFNK